MQPRGSRRSDQVLPESMMICPGGWRGRMRRGWVHAAQSLLREQMMLWAVHRIAAVGVRADADESTVVAGYHFSVTEIFPTTFEACQPAAAAYEMAVERRGDFRTNGRAVISDRENCAQMRRWMQCHRVSLLASSPNDVVTVPGRDACRGADSQR